LVRCAAIAASIARRKADEPKILEENGLDAPTWLELKAHHDAAISAEVRRGKLDLLKAYDRAYVDRLEKERGPITVQQYARLLVASERGTADETLRDLDLPRGAALRIERLWTERSARDPAVAAQLREAVRAARST
jgi:hypothetical protein